MSVAGSSEVNAADPHRKQGARCHDNDSLAKSLVRIWPPATEHSLMLRSFHSCCRQLIAEKHVARTLFNGASSNSKVIQRRSDETTVYSDPEVNIKTRLGSTSRSCIRILLKSRKKDRKASVKIIEFKTKTSYR